MDYPLMAYLQQGITAGQARALLAEHDCLSFPRLQSGLFPAANFDDLESDETGMANAWLRDSAFIGLMLLAVGETEAAKAAGVGVLRCLHSVQAEFKGTGMRPPVRFTGQDSQPLREWANAQNDALGYGLQCIGKLVEAGLLELSSDDVALLSQIVQYLGAIEYWHDADDSGHWEEIPKVNASSIGTVVAGLLAVRSLLELLELVDQLVQYGTAALQALLPRESDTPGLERADDAALIFLVEPQQLLHGGSAAEIVAHAEANLKGEHGFRRYNGDSYWGPDYREHFLTGDRAADFSKPEDMARRDAYLTPGGEAQWTFFDPMLAAYYARRYQTSSDQADAAAAAHYLARALSGIVTHNKPGVGVVWRLPELFFLEQGQWVPNDHLGLLWGQANLLYGLQVFAKVFGDKLITG